MATLDLCSGYPVVEGSSPIRALNMALKRPTDPVAYETDGNGTVLASFSYDSQGVPTSVRVGSDPAPAPLYYYVDNGHGDTIALTDATGAAVASYSYDPWGVVTSDTESFANGWHNPYLYDGRDGARYDQETGLYWLAVRAYDPTIGRFLSRDPLGRVPLVGWSDQPYVYAGNNPLVNVDPSGQRFVTESAAQAKAAVNYHKQKAARVQARRGCGLDCKGQIAKAKKVEFYARILDALDALTSLVELGRDIFRVWRDWNTEGGIDRTLNIIGDFISIAADLASVGVGALVFASHWIDVSGALHVFHALAAILKGISAAYKVFLSASGWFIQAAKIAFFTAVTAFKFGFGELNLPGLVLGVGLAVLKKMGFKVDGEVAFEAIIDAIQGGIHGVNWLVDGVQSLGGAQYCRQHMNECQ